MNVAKVDKYGRHVESRKDDLKRFYRAKAKLEESEDEEADPMRGKGVESSSNSSSEEEEEEGEDAGELDLEQEENPLLPSSLLNQIQPQPKEEGEATHRLAVIGLDWDHIKVPHRLYY